MVNMGFRSASAILLITVITVAGIAFVIMPSSGMQWFIQEGDTLSFTVEVEGFVRVFDPLNSSLWTDSPTPYMYLDGTSIAVEVSDLPVPVSGFTSDSFANLVIEHTKCSLTFPIELVNGTELPAEEHLFLNELVSRSLLPIGGWTGIDAFYPDVPDSIFQCDTYLSSSDLSTFSIGHRVYNIDAGHGWNATLDMNTGVPVQATTWASQYYGSQWFSYSITVTLISD